MILLKHNANNMSRDLIDVVPDLHMIGFNRDQVEFPIDIGTPVHPMSWIAHAGTCGLEKQAMINGRKVPDAAVETLRPTEHREMIRSFAFTETAKIITDKR